MVDRAPPDRAQDDRHRRIPHRLPDRARRRAAQPRHLQDRAGIHRRLDRAALPQRSRHRRPALRANRRRQRQSDHAGARRLLAGPRRGSGRTRAGGARRLQRGGGAIDQLLRPAGARETRTDPDRAERRRGGRGRSAERLEIVRAVAAALRSRRRRDRDPDLRRHGRQWRSGRPAGLAELAARQGDARAMLLVGKSALNRGLPFDHYAYPVNGVPPFRADRPGDRAERGLLDRAPGKRLQSGRGFAGAGVWADAGDAGCRSLCLQARRRRLRHQHA